MRSIASVCFILLASLAFACRKEPTPDSVPRYVAVEGTTPLRCTDGRPPELRIYTNGRVWPSAQPIVDAKGHYQFTAPEDRYDFQFSCADGSAVGYTLNHVRVESSR